MKKTIILDLSKDRDFKLKNALIFQLSFGISKLENCKIIDKNFYTDNKFQIFTKKINNSFLKFYKFLKDKKVKENILTLELFNQRNDKNQLFNKIFILTEILNYLKKKKIKEIEIITDDCAFFYSYKSIKNKKIKVINISKKKYYYSYKEFFIKTFYFHLKSLIIIAFSKLINKKTVSSQINSEACLSIFPLFYINNKHTFYNKKFLNFNFQITDETHLGNSLLKNIVTLFKVNKIRNTLSVESFIKISNIFSNFFRSLKNYELIKKTQKFKFKINDIDFSYQFKNLFFNSLLNLNKLNMCESAFEGIIKNNKIKKFHFYLFEYNFGYYLCNLINKVSPKTILVGYQHGIYSERLMWQNFSKKINFKNYFPHEIVCKYPFSLEAYKNNFKDIKIFLNKKKKDKKKYKIKNYIKNEYNVYLGLHDCYGSINELRNLNKNKKFILNLHPKMKFKNKLNLKKNMKINFDKLFYKNRKKILSSTSTMPYQLYPNEKFNIIVPKNIIPLNPKFFDKMIFKNN